MKCAFCERGYGILVEREQTGLICHPSRRGVPASPSGQNALRLLRDGWEPLLDPNQSIQGMAGDAKLIEVSVEVTLRSKGDPRRHYEETGAIARSCCARHTP